MKKSIIFCLFLISIGVAVVSAKDMSWGGSQRFVQELNLEPERAVRMQEILDSYRAIGQLYTSGQQEKIPAFLSAKEAELNALLTDEELAQFKASIGAWAKGKDFTKFMKFAHKQHH
jgi:hypothetical protein